MQVQVRKKRESTHIIVAQFDAVLLESNAVEPRPVD